MRIISSNVLWIQLLALEIEWTRGLLVSAWWHLIIAAEQGLLMCVLVLPFLQRNSCRAPSCTCFTSSHLLRRGEGWDLSYEFTGRRMTWHYCAVLSHSVVSNSCPPPRTVVLQAPLSMGILQARMLVWVAMPSSRVSSQPMDQTQVSHIAGRFFTVWATREVIIIY